MSTPFLIRVVRWGFCLAILATIIAGLYVSGSPANRRRITLDERRVNSLNQISFAIDNYTQTKGIPPASLDALSQHQTYVANDLRDPSTGNFYEYLPADVSTSTYQLCATFDLPTQFEESVVPSTTALDTWGNPTALTHGTGRTCYLFHVRELTPATAPIVPKPLPSAVR